MRATRATGPRSPGTTNATAIGFSPRASEMKPIPCVCEGCNCRQPTGLVICPRCRNMGHGNPKIQTTVDVERRGKMRR